MASQMGATWIAICSRFTPLVMDVSGWSAQSVRQSVLLPVLAPGLHLHFFRRACRSPVVTDRIRYSRQQCVAKALIHALIGQLNVSGHKEEATSRRPLSSTHYDGDLAHVIGADLIGEGRVSKVRPMILIEPRRVFEFVLVDLKQ